jgi:hypothetical protein
MSLSGVTVTSHCQESLPEVTGRSRGSLLLQPQVTDSESVAWQCQWLETRARRRAVTVRGRRSVSRRCLSRSGGGSPARELPVTRRVTVQVRDGCG